MAKVQGRKSGKASSGGRKPGGGFTSLREVARHFGVSANAVHKWTRTHDDCPIRGKGPWSKVEVLGWYERVIAPRRAEQDLGVGGARMLAAALEGGAAGAGTGGGGGTLISLDAGSKAKLALTVERTRKIRTEREILEGKYIKRTEVLAERLKRAHTIKQVFLQLPKTLAQDTEIELLGDEVRKTVERVCRTQVISILMRLAGGVMRKPTDGELKDAGMQDAAQDTQAQEGEAA